MSQTSLVLCEGFNCTFDSRMHYKSAFKGELDAKCWGYSLAIVFTNDAASQTYSFTHSKTCIWCHVVPGTVQISKARYRHK